MLTERDASIETVLTYTRGLDNARKKADGLADIAAHFKALEGVPDSLGSEAGLFNEAIEAAATIEDANSRAFALIGIAKSAQNLKLTDIGRKAFGAAEAAARQIKEQSDKNTVMRQIDQMRSQFGG